MLDDALYHDLQCRTEAGGDMLLDPAQLLAVTQALSEARALRDRERQLIAALKAVEFGAVGIKSTAPACPVCRSACGMGHLAACPVGAALQAVETAA